MKSPYRRILDKLLSLQESVYRDHEVNEEAKKAEGRVSVLVVKDVLCGDRIPLKIVKGRVKLASREDEKLAVHIFETDGDCFLDVLSGEMDLRAAATLGRFKIMDAETEEINIVEIEKFSRAFERLRRLVPRLKERDV